MKRLLHATLGMLLVVTCVFGQATTTTQIDVGDTTAPNSISSKSLMISWSPEPNQDLEIKKREVEGQHSAAQENLNAIVAQLTNASPALTAQERIRLEGEQARLRPQLKSLADQLRLIDERIAQGSRDNTKKREIEEQYNAAQIKLKAINQQLTNPDLELSAQERARLKSEATQLVRQIDSHNRQELGLPARREGATETKPDETQIKVFALRNARAVDAERLVNQLFNREIRSVAADERSNSLIVRGSPDDLNVIFAILTRLDEDLSHQPPPAAGTTGSAGGGGLPTAVSGANAAKEYEAKERQAASLALQVRELKSDGKGDQSKLNKQTADLRRVVGEAFAARQQLHHAELGQLQQRMSNIRQSLNTRESLKDQIIDRRVKDLLDPSLQWEAGSPALRTDDRSAMGRSPAQNAAAQAVADKLRDRWKQVQTLYENGRASLTEALQAAKDLNDAEIAAATTEIESRDARQAAVDRLKQIQAIVDAKVAQSAAPEFHKLTVDAEVLKAEQQSTDDRASTRFNDRAQLFARLHDDRKWVENANEDINRAGITAEQRRSAREVKLSWLRDIVIVLLRLRQSGEVSEKVLAAAEAEMQQAEAELTADYASSVPGESSQKTPATETAATSLVPPPGGNLRGDISAMIWTVLGVSVTVVEGEELKKAGLPRGLLVEKVRPDGPTQMLHQGDIIVGVHRWATDSVPTLAWCILQPIARDVAVVEPTSRSTAETVKLHLLRGGEIERVDVELQPWAPGPRPSRSAPSWVGQGNSNAATNANVPVIAGKTTTLLGPSEFRERLIEQERQLAQHKAADPTKFSGDPENNKKLIDEATRRAERELSFLREEYAAQLRLIELEVQDAAAAVATAQQMQKIAQEGVASGQTTQGNLLGSERAVQEANLRFQRAKTLLDLYRKADPKDSAAEADEAPVVEPKPR